MFFLGGGLAGSLFPFGGLFWFNLLLVGTPGGAWLCLAVPWVDDRAPGTHKRHALNTSRHFNLNFPLLNLSLGSTVHAYYSNIRRGVK